MRSDLQYFASLEANSSYREQICYFYLWVVYFFRRMNIYSFKNGLTIVKEFPVPGLGKAFPLVLVHPEDISKRWDGGCLRCEFNGTVRLVAQHRDLSIKYT